MNGILLVIFVLSVLAARYWYGIRSHHRVWMAQVEGKTIHINIKETTCTIMIDGVLVLESPIEKGMRMVHTTTGIRPRQSFRYSIKQAAPAFEGKILRLESDWYHSNTKEPDFYIGNTRIPLIELEDKSPESIQNMQASLQKEDATIEDPRWKSSYELLIPLRASLEEEDQKSIDLLLQQLSSRFLILEEIKGENAATIWVDQEEREQMIAHLDEEIEMCLLAVQELHKHSIQKRQQDLQDDGLDDVINLLQKLDSEQEVENLSKNSKRKLRQRLAQKKS